MDLQRALNVRPGELVSFIGDDGRIAAAWLLLRLLVGHGERVVLTTTTHISAPRQAPRIIARDPTPASVALALMESPALILAAGHRGETTDQAGDHQTRPVELVGLRPTVLDELAHRLPGVTWLVQADVETGRQLKAPAKDEPVIPSRSSRVVVTAGLEAVGRPLDERTVHRPAAAARILRVSPGTAITPDLFANLVAHASGGLKGIPAYAEAVVLLIQQNGPPHPEAATVARLLLLSGRIRRVVLADLRAPDPVLEVWG